MNNDQHFGEPNKIYFSDGNGKVLKTYNMFPESRKLIKMYANVRTSQKYLAAQSKYIEGKNEVNKLTIMDKSGKFYGHPILMPLVMFFSMITMIDFLR